MTNVDEKASFVHFVYPFLFDAGAFDARTKATENARWQGREREFKVWNQEPFPEFDLLPHVARYLNSPPGTLPSARLWEIGSEVFQSPAGLGARADWKLILPKREGISKEIPFCFEGVQLRAPNITSGPGSNR